MKDCELFMSENEMMEGDYSGSFTTDEIFKTRDDLLKWVWCIAFLLVFIVIIVISDTINGHSERRTFVLLGCE